MPSAWQARLFQYLDDPLVDLFDLADAGDLVQQALFLIIGDEAARVLVVELQAFANRVFTIVFPLNQFGLTIIADFWAFGADY